MKLLTKWLLTKTLPAYHDRESGTVLEQTHKLYNSMNELINEYNEFVEDTNTKLLEFFNKYNEDIELFSTSFRQEFQDFIDIVDIKLVDLQNKIDNVQDIDLSPIQSQIDGILNELNTFRQEIEELVNGEIATIKKQLAELDIEYVGKTGSENGYISVEVKYDDAGLPNYYPAFKNYEMEEPVKLATENDVERMINEAINSALEGNY